MSYCGYCKSEDSIQLYPSQDVFGNNYFIHKCNKCKAYFLAPRPDALLLKKAYNPAYYGESEDSKFLPIIEDFIDYFRSARARALKRKLEAGSWKLGKNPTSNIQHLTSYKVLDIGCGNGKFLSYLSKYENFELFGSELEGNSAKRASQIPGINLKIGVIEKNDFALQTFDAITLFHVFEHLTEPELMLEIIADIIKKDGLLIISFPNITSLQSRLFKGKWFHMDPPRHLFFFSPEDFVILMENFGFKLVSSKYFSFEQNPYGSIQSILNLLSKKREVLYERLKGNAKYAPEYSRINIIFQKLFFFVTFPIFAFTEIFHSIFKVGATVEFTFKKNSH